MTDEQFRGLPETMTRKEFSALSGIPVRTLNRRVAEGHIRVVRIGNGHPRWLKIELARLLGREYHARCPAPRTPPDPSP